MASPAPGVSARSRWLRPLAGALIGIAFALLLATRVDWSEVGRLLGGATPAPIVLAVGALAAGMFLRVARWWWMLRAFDPGLPLASCARPFLVSLALNNTLPLRAGDVVRVVGFGRTLRAPSARVLGTVVLERLLDLLALLLIFALATLGAGDVFPRGFLLAVGIAGAGGVAVLLLLVTSPGLLARLAQRALGAARARWPGAQRLAPAVEQLVTSLSLLANRRRAAGLLGLTLAAWTMEGLVFAASAAALAVPHSWQAPWLSLSAATLSTLLPGTPGYVGTFDWFATLGLMAYGVGRSGAAATAVLVHLILWLPITITGLALLGMGRRRVTQLGAESA